MGIVDAVVAPDADSTVPGHSRRQRVFVGARHSFDVREIFAVARHDLFGTKDVQDAITASYVWLADQLGHIALGAFPALILCWLWRMVWPSHPIVVDIGMPLLAAAVFAYWVVKEVQDFQDSKHKATFIFPFDAADLWWNVATALIFFATGILSALAANYGFLPFIACFVVLIGFDLFVAFWWLKRKVAFQQAGLPYLYRLANFHADIDQAGRDAVLAVSADPNRQGGRHLLVTGPIGAGKTSLAVGIGTEFAFKLGIGRYLTLSKLLQLADEKPTQSVLEYDDGRVLWPWREVDLLVVDDVDFGLASLSLVGPVAVADALRTLQSEKSVPPLAWLKDRRSVWVVGAGGDLEAWRQALAELIGLGDKEEIKLVALAIAPTSP